MQNNIFLNPVFWASFFAVTIAQLAKPFISLFSGAGFKAKLIFSNGGMPSSHTAGVTAMATAIGIQEGFGSTLFIISFVFSLVVMNDAINVRLETGKQSELINEWSAFFNDFFKGEGIFSKRHFKTMVGHTIFQVLWGLALGITIGLIVTLLFKHYV